MKTDLVTSIIAAVVGAVAAYFITNLCIGPIEGVTYKTIDTTVNANIESPDPEVFNYHALNPTVEVYVGECEELNQFGECVEVVENVKETPNPEINNQETD